MKNVRKALLACLAGLVWLGVLTLPALALDPASVPGQTATRTPTPRYPFYLPKIYNYYPPYPFIPRLYTIDSPQGGAYRLEWSETPHRFADTYVIQEAADPDFTREVRTACVTAQSECELIDMKAGQYYYRVMGINDWGSSAWSNVQTAQVLLPEIPVLYRVTDQAGDGSFTIRWSAAARADRYTLQSSADPRFTNPLTVQTSATQWPVTGGQVGPLYFRVQALGATGVSAWSELLAVNLSLPDVPSMTAVKQSGVDGFYTVSWSAAALASSYILEESTDRTFSLAVTAYTGPELSWKALNKDYGSYYYRVKAVNVQGESAWSGPRLVIVQKPKSGVWIQGNSYTYSRDGLRHVVGEVFNNTSDTLRFMRVDVMFFDASGQQVATDFVYTYLNTIFPGGRACFHLSVAEPAGWRTYRVRGSYTLGPVEDPNLATTNLQSTPVANGSYRISGSVRNPSAGVVSYVAPIATLYNSDGFVVDCSYAYANSETLQAYQASNFTIDAHPPDATAVALFTVKVDFRLGQP